MLIIVFTSTPCVAKLLQGGVEKTVLDAQSQSQSLEAGVSQRGFRLFARVPNQNLNKRSPQEDHGRIPDGILGATIPVTTVRQPLRILAMSQKCDLRNHGVEVGDLILTVNGQEINTKEIRELTNGEPGTMVDIEILHRGYVQKMRVAIMSARDALDIQCYEQYDDYLQRCANRTLKRW